jgi:hypothetical protein
VSTSRREHPRYAHEAVVKLHTGTLLVTGRTRNISRGGLCATLIDPSPIGSEIEVDLQLVFEDSSESEVLRLPARIVWCTEIDDAFQIGVAFKPLAELAQYLTLFLGFLDGGEKPERLRRESKLDKRFG